MTHIHTSAVVAPTAQLGKNVTVGPFCLIDDDVQIGDGTRLASHVVVHQRTRLGADNEIFEGAVLGGRPQHLQKRERWGKLIVGDGNTIRENATIHRALDEGNSTVVGDQNLVMINAHIAHDCCLGSHTILANNVMLAGHITIGDRAYLSGGVGVHQFCRIGAYAMVGGQSHIKRDVPPYVTVDGYSSQIVGLNLIGLKRSGFTGDEIQQLKAAYRLIYRSGMKWSDMLQELAEKFPDGPAGAFHPFFSGGQRGFIAERRTPKSATLKLARGAATDDKQKNLRKAG